jgi:hypothetical protein
MVNIGIMRQTAARVEPRLKGGPVNQPRAADDFEVIRERLEELRREREETEAAEKSGNGSAEDTEDDAEKQGRAQREGVPPAWVPTIFLPQPTD